jgi:hypothetical protein
MMLCNECEAYLLLKTLLQPFQEFLRGVRLTPLSMPRIVLRWLLACFTSIIWRSAAWVPGVDWCPVEDERQEVLELLFEASSHAPGTVTTAYLQRVLELEPLHEEALQALLKQLLKRGRKRDARQHYRAFKERLYENMQLEPLAETQRIVVQ